MSEVKKNILLVEDEVLLAMNEKMQLEQYGYAVKTANTGEKAVEAVKTSSDIDLILMDINLGKGIDGTQAAEIILQDRDIPVVFLSSHTEPEIVEKTEKITSYGYVVKNSSVTVLDASIKMAFKLFDANRARYEAARLMEKTSEHVPGAVYQYKMNSDGTACFPFSTHGIWDIYELTPEELRADVDKLSERTHPDDLKRVIESVQESYVSMEPWECEFRVVLPERGERWIRGTANPEQAEDGVLWHGYFSDITDRKQSEEELLQTNRELLKAKEKAQSIEEQTRFILKHNPNAIAVFDNDMNTVMVSDRYLEDYDLKDKDIIGKNHYEVFPEMPERWKEVHSRALRGETLSNDDDSFVRSDGSVTYTRWECRPWYRSDNSIGGMIAYTEVITERKRAEQALSYRNALLKAQMEASPDGILIVDEDDNIISFNQRFADMWELPDDITGAKSAEEAMKHAFPKLSNPDEFYSRIRELHRNKLEKSYEEIALMNGGVLERYSSPMGGFGGEYFGRIWFYRDITERKRLQDSTELQSELLDNIGQAAIATDSQGTVIYWNRMAETVYGWSAREALGKNILDLTPASQTKKQAADIMQRMVQGKKWSGEFTARRRDGSSFPAQVNNAPIFNDEGNLIGIIGISADITERKQAEEALHKTSNLQSIILRTASDYINKSIEEVDKTINKSLKELGEFVGADRAYVFEYDWVKDVANNTYEWCAEDVNPEIDNLQEFPNKGLDYLVEAHRNGKDLGIEDVQELPRDDAVRQVLEPQGVKSILTIPMIRNGECLGFVGFDSVRDNRKYSETERALLKVFSEMLVSIEHRKELEQKLICAKEQAEENAADLTAIIEGATDSIWSFDRNYDIRYINDRFRSDFYDAFGVWLEKGSNLIHALPEVLRPIWEPRYDRVLSNEQFIVTDEVGTENGTRYVQVSFNPIVQGDQVIGGSCFGSDITDRKAAELEIQKQLTEKETLLREVHHRVKNNMATIESLLSLQIGATPVPEVKTALQDTIARVQSTRVLYDKLLVGDDLNQVSIEPYANGIIDAIAAVFDLEKTIVIERHIGSFGISPKKAFFLGIIVNELLTNVFKYAFTDHSAGKVSVSIGKQDDEVTLILKDNGVGFDERTLKNKSPGFGLTVVQMLVEQSGGTFSQSNDNGAKSVVRFEL